MLGSSFEFFFFFKFRIFFRDLSNNTVISVKEKKIIDIRISKDTKAKVKWNSRRPQNDFKQYLSECQTEFTRRSK